MGKIYTLRAQVYMLSQPGVDESFITDIVRTHSPRDTERCKPAGTTQRKCWPFVATCEPSQSSYSSSYQERPHTSSKVSSSPKPSFCISGPRPALNPRPPVGLPIELPALRWFLSLFSSVFAPDFVLQIFDQLFLVGYKALFQVAIGFMSHIQDQILECEDPEGAQNL